MKTSFRFWLCVTLIWFLAIWIDRLWWNHYTDLPSWDQADYLNSALDHARALGLMPGTHWQGWGTLLDLSPKIPPLGSIVNGSVLAIAGDDPRQAAWSLSIWHGLLLISVGAWGIRLRGEGFALLGVLFVAIAPALFEIRTDYVLEMPLTAMVSLALWRLGCWWDPRQGGRWDQAIWAAFACTCALLVKQSALLVLIPSVLWAGYGALCRTKETRLQFFVGLGVVALSLFPWLKHNWITTLGGTYRAVIESAIREGDPTLWTIENWVWYPRLLPEQVGSLILILGLSGGLLWTFSHYRRTTTSRADQDYSDEPFAWRWLIFTLLAGWLLTTLSPNKGDRYITPLLPPFLLVLARGWWQWGIWLASQLHKRLLFSLPIALLAGVSANLLITWPAQMTRFVQGNQGPLKQVVKAAGGANPFSPLTTLIVVPSTPDLNQHNVSFFGRMSGGNLVGRQLGSSPTDVEPVLMYAQWVLLAEGDQGSVRESAMLLDNAVRNSGVFYIYRSFERPYGGSYSLWRRKHDAISPPSFSKNFPKLAMGLKDGPKGVEEVFAVIEVQHMLDGHMQYRVQTSQTASERLLDNPSDLEALWTLALLKVLGNRPAEASAYFATLEKLLPQNPWPSIYRSIVTLAGLNPWKAAEIADGAKKKYANDVLTGLADLSGVVGGAIWRLPSASVSIPKAIKQVEKEINSSLNND